MRCAVLSGFQLDFFSLWLRREYSILVLVSYCTRVPQRKVQSTGASSRCARENRTSKNLKSLAPGKVPPERPDAVSSEKINKTEESRVSRARGGRRAAVGGRRAAAGGRRSRGRGPERGAQRAGAPTTRSLRSRAERPNTFSCSPASSRYRVSISMRKEVRNGQR